MKKVLFPFLITLLYSNVTFSQASSVEVEWGPLLKAKDTDFNYVIGADDEFFYTFGVEDKGMFGALLARDLHIKKYSRDKYRLIYDREIKSFEYKGKDADFAECRIENGEVHVFFKVFHSQLDTKFMIRRIVDAKGRVSASEEVANVPAERRSDGNFIINYSKDSSKVLIYSDFPYEKKESEKFKVNVLDRNLNMLWEKEVTLPYTDKYFTLQDQTVTNDGDVFIIGYAEPDRDKGERKQRKESNEYYKVFRVSENDDIMEYDLGLDDKFVSSVAISSDFGENQMAIAGFYSDQKANRVGGSFYITIDQETLDPTTFSSEPFGKDFMKNFMSDRKVEKGRELYNFEFREFLRRKDGGAVAVAEQYYVVTSTTRMANGATSTTYYYHYNDIIVININPDGTIAWTSHIPKFQTSANDGGFYSSYLLLVEEQALNFIFNDNRKNLQRMADDKDLKGLGNVKKSVAIISTVDANGNVTREELFNNRDLSAILVPKKSVQISDREVILFGIKRSRNRFGTMTLR